MTATFMNAPFQTKWQERVCIFTGTSNLIAPFMNKSHCNKHTGTYMHE